MRKLYALLLGVILTGLLGAANIATAQYTPSSYSVITNNDVWTPLSGGTTVTELLATQTGDFFTKCESFSHEITLPFNFQLINLVSNKLKIAGSGSLILGGSNTVSDATTYDYFAYYGYGECYYNYSGPGYVEGVNNQIMAWTGSSFPVKGSCNVQYATLGTAPNRQFVVEIDGWGNYAAAYDASEGSTLLQNYNECTISYQYILYEGSSFISKFDIVYGPFHSGNNSNSYYYESEFYDYVVTGIRSTPGTILTAYLGNYNSLGPNGANVTTSTGMYDNGYYWYSTGPSTNQGMTWAIRYPYNLAFTHPSPYPADQQILLINNSFVPQVSVTNEGANAVTAASVNCTITEAGVASPVYNQTVALSGTQLPGPNGKTGTAVSFPSYTPTSYGLYSVTYTIVSTTPPESYTLDNVYSTSFIVSPPNNVASISSLTPAPNSRTPVGYATPVSFRFRNMGVNNQSNVPVSIYITNPLGSVIYRDTAIIQYWSSTPGLQIRDTQFKDWTPPGIGTYTLCGVTLLSTDQNHADDTVCTSVTVRCLSDVAAVTVLNPDDQEEKPEKKEFKPQGSFQNVGVQDLFDVPARCLIYRCSDGSKVFQADSSIPELNVDAGIVKFSFPSTQGANDIAKLAPGCYKLCVVANQTDDCDHTNDTACQSFAIIPRLQGTFQVGVGRHFQTITSAIDTMRFRGIGGNVTLMLMDANYTENGNTDASSINAAVDFANIVGTGPNAVIKWVPAPNVFPTITFTGNKQYCIGIQDLSPSYMIWDGNNQQVQTPDALTAEPNKRGITIINQSTAAGSIFGLQYGRDHQTIKNLNLINNGNLTNSASSAIALVNVYSFQSYYNNHVLDTAGFSYITIDNCMMGNANTGISDIGTVPQFNIGQAQYVNLRNNHNVISRNTIGTSTYPIGQTGIIIGNEDGLVVQRNEISNVLPNTNAFSYSSGISANSGNNVNLLINANKIHNITSPTAASSTVAGIDIAQSSVIYVTGTGSSARTSTLPVVTGNRVVNNFVYDLRQGSTGSAVPIRDMTVGSSTYTVQNDSVFNNSIAVANAQFMVQMNHVAKPFIWNNILQNLNTSSSTTAVLYNLTVPRPMFSNVSANNNLIDFRNASLFANMSEYDASTGVSTYSVKVPTENAWRTMSSQDVFSVGGDPMFVSDSLHMPGASTYIYTTASNNGAWLGTATQSLDYDGDPRLVGGSTPDIGADEFDGFQYANDLAVMTITKPTGITNTSGVTQVTAENPLAIQAIVKNMGEISVSNRSVTALVEYSTNSGASWTTLGSTTSAQMTWNVGEAKTVDIVGPTITNEATRLFRVTVSVPNDQYNANNSQQKVFQIAVKRQATMLSYNSSTLKGRQNKDSLAAALQRLGMPYDSLDRNAWGANLIDYSPWWTIVWASGDPTTAYYSSGGVNLGVGSVSLQEEQEIINLLKAGQTYAKKSLIIAGQNIAQYLDTAASNSQKQLNNVVTDGEFMLGWMHTRLVNQYPGLIYPPATPTSYRGLLTGNGVYFVFADTINAASPDVVKPTPITGVVGTNTSRFAYTYNAHPSTPSDSGAGVAWNGATYNLVFYPFDWADAVQTVGWRDGEIAPVNVSGTTRFLRGALDFIKSYGGIVLPVEFTDVKGYQESDGNLITWSVAAQKNVDHYEVELLTADNTWTTAGTVVASNNTSNYSFLHNAAQVMETGKTYTYRVESVDLDGARIASNTVNVERTAAGPSFTVDQNSPNPFVSTTTLGYTLPESGNVTLRVLDLTGKTVAVVYDNAAQSAGHQTVSFNGGALASGTYICEVSFTNSNGETTVLRNKMTLTR